MTYRFIVNVITHIHITIHLFWKKTFYNFSFIEYFDIKFVKIWIYPIPPYLDFTQICQDISISVIILKKIWRKFWWKKVLISCDIILFLILQDTIQIIWREKIPTHLYNKKVRSRDLLLDYVHKYIQSLEYICTIAFN